MLQNLGNLGHFLKEFMHFPTKIGQKAGKMATKAGKMGQNRGIRPLFTGPLGSHIFLAYIRRDIYTRTAGFFIIGA